MKTPAEVIEALNGTDRDCVSLRLAALREWLSTPEGQVYIADLSEPCDSAWVDQSCQTFTNFAEPVGAEPVGI